MKLNLKFFFLFINILFMLLVFMNCSNDVKNVYKLIENKFGVEERVIIENPTKFKIYIDASKSMKGFVNQTDFKNFIGKLVTSFKNTNDVEYYFFDTTLKRMSDYLNLFNTSIFIGYRANFDKLFENLYEEFKKDTNSLYLLITDFQFNNFNIYYNTLNSFQNILLNKGYIKFFASQFNFNGLIFPQFVNAKPFNYQGLRPIYLIMIGRYNNAKFIEELADNLLINFYTITLTKKIPLKSELQAFDHTLSKTNVKKNHYRINKFSIKFSLVLESPLFNDWHRFSNDDFYITSYYFYRDSLLMKSPEISIDSVKIVSVKQERKLIIYISSKSNIEDKVNVYNVQFVPKTFPVWIDSLSTDDNNISAQTSKTIWLKRFFEDLFRTVTDRLVLFEKTIIIEK